MPHIQLAPIRFWRAGNGPLTRYGNLRVAHAPGMPETFSPPPRVSNPDVHQCTCVTHVPWCMPGLLTSGYIRSHWRRKCSRHSRRMRNTQYSVSGKRPMAEWVIEQLDITVGGGRCLWYSKTRVQNLGPTGEFAHSWIYPADSTRRHVLRSPP